MGQHRLMTIGALLILLGIQLYCVRTYWITPKAAQFVQRRIMEVDEATSADSAAPRIFNTGYSNPYNANFSSSTGGEYELSPPSWLKWAALFAGSVLLLQGLALPK